MWLINARPIEHAKGRVWHNVHIVNMFYCSSCVVNPPACCSLHNTIMWLELAEQVYYMHCARPFLSCTVGKGLVSPDYVPNKYKQWKQISVHSHQTLPPFVCAKAVVHMACETTYEQQKTAFNLRTCHGLIK